MERLGFEVERLWFQGLRVRVLASRAILEFIVEGSGFRVEDIDFRVEGLLWLLVQEF